MKEQLTPVLEKLSKNIDKFKTKIEKLEKEIFVFEENIVNTLVYYINEEEKLNLCKEKNAILKDSIKKIDEILEKL